MVEIKVRSSLKAKKGKAEPAIVNPTFLATFARNVFETLAADKTVTAQSIWENQTTTAKIPLDMVERAHWLLHEKQQQRLTPDVLDEFQKAAWGQPSKDLATLGLDAKEVEIVRDVLARKPQTKPNDTQKIIQADLDQIAMIFLLMRQGASNKAAKAAFRHATSDSSINRVRNEIILSFPKYNHLSAWLWEDRVRPVLKR